MKEKQDNWKTVADTIKENSTTMHAAICGRGTCDEWLYTSNWQESITCISM